MGNKNKYKSGSIFDMQFITSSISTTLVLLLLGLVVFFVLTAHNLSVYVRENISFSVLISDDMKEADILKLQKKLNQEPFVKQSEYISKKQALKEQTEAMGTDPEEFLGYNPFTASIEIKLHSDYANSDSIAKIEKMEYQSGITGFGGSAYFYLLCFDKQYDKACYILQALPHPYNETGGGELELHSATVSPKECVEWRAGCCSC